MTYSDLKFGSESNLYSSLDSNPDSESKSKSKSNYKRPIVKGRCNCITCSLLGFNKLSLHSETYEDKLFVQNLSTITSHNVNNHHTSCKFKISPETADIQIVVTFSFSSFTLLSLFSLSTSSANL
jgi:hypothetical protein